MTLLRIAVVGFAVVMIPLVVVAIATLLELPRLLRIILSGVVIVVMIHSILTYHERKKKANTKLPSP